LQLQTLDTAHNWVSNYKAQHIIGNRLPRGKAFDAGRDSFENKHQSAMIGTKILNDLACVVSLSYKERHTGFLWIVEIIKR
jgi:hypothetical protein